MGPKERNLNSRGSNHSGGEPLDMSAYNGDPEAVAQAAVKIQARFRGYQTRKDVAALQKKQQAATDMQRLFRGHRARRHVAKKKRMYEKAATKIQSTYRKHRVEEDLHHQRAAAVRIQAKYRGFSAEHTYGEQRAAAVKIQSVYRGHSTRLRLQQYKFVGPALPLLAECIREHLTNLGRSADGQKFVYLDLDVENYGIGDIRALEDYPHLQSLALRSNGVHDLTPLVHLPHLLRLDLRQNCVDELLQYPLQSSLTDVDLSQNAISRMLDISQHKYIRRLVLDGNRIFKINGISHLSSLSVLSLSNNNILKISGLDNLPIRELYLNDNSIKTLRGLGKLRRLEVISVNNNRISSLRGLQGHPRLKRIEIRNNVVALLSEVQHLKELSILHSLDMSDNPIQRNTPDYRLRVVYRLQMMEALDGVLIDEKEKVSALNYHGANARHLFSTRSSSFPAEKLPDEVLEEHFYMLQAAFDVGGGRLHYIALRDQIRESMEKFGCFDVAKQAECFTRLAKSDADGRIPIEYQDFVDLFSFVRKRQKLEKLFLAHGVWIPRNGLRPVNEAALENIGLVLTPREDEMLSGMDIIDPVEDTEIALTFYDLYRLIFKEDLSMGPRFNPLGRGGDVDRFMAALDPNWRRGGSSDVYIGLVEVVHLLAYAEVLPDNTIRNPFVCATPEEVDSAKTIQRVFRGFQTRSRSRLSDR
eukprot:Rmarinus@m.9264